MTTTMKKEPVDTLVFTRCVFFRGGDTTRLERQVNYFLTYAPLAALHRMETTAVGEDVLVTLWFETLPGASGVDEVYSAAVHLEGQ